jgi:uncharacterized small protein (DUF1192 family)
VPRVGIPLLERRGAREIKESFTMSRLLDSPAAIPLPDASSAPPSRQPRPRRPRPRPAVREPGERRAGLADVVEPPPSPEVEPSRNSDVYVVQSAHEIAKELYGCGELSERIAIYKRTGERFKSDYRRVLNIAAVQWPELIPMVNDLPEWKALLSADLS